VRRDKTLGTIFAALTEVLFPSRCLACLSLLPDGSRHSLCPACDARIRYIKEPLCPVCGLPFEAGTTTSHPCGACLKERPPFDVARALGRYEGPLLEVIHRFKYRKDTAAGEALGRLAASYPFFDFSFTAYDVLVPVPLHLRRLRERGFNQALVLGRVVARHHHLALDFDAVARHRDTTPQVSLDGKDRRENVRDAFVVVRPQCLEGKRVLLVDDVFTTGSTVSECARVVKKAGAAWVGVFTVARVV